MVEGILIAELPQFAGQIRAHLNRIARHDKYEKTAAEYEAEIMAGKIQVWSLSNFEAMALTSVQRSCVKLEWVVGHNRHKWQEALDAELRAWANHLGKPRLIVNARPGWARLAKKLGYREMQRVYEVAL